MVRSKKKLVILMADDDEDDRLLVEGALAESPVLRTKASRLGKAFLRS